MCLRFNSLMSGFMEIKERGGESVFPKSWLPDSDFSSYGVGEGEDKSRCVRFESKVVFCTVALIRF